MNLTTEQPYEHNRSAWTVSVEEHGYWKTWLNSMTPERWAQERERSKKYNQDHKEENNKKRQERYQQSKERLCEKHVCETCGGHYTTQTWTQHSKTKIHQDALANISPTCFICEKCDGRHTDTNKSRHCQSKKHQAALRQS